MEWLETAGRILPFWVANPVRGAAAVAGVVFLIWSVWPLLTKNADVAKPAASPLPSATDARVSNTGTISGSVVVGGDVRGDIKVQQAPPSRTVKADESSPLELRVYGVPSDGPYPAGTMIAGIRWGDHLTDTRVQLVNRTDETIVDLGLSIQR